VDIILPVGSLSEQVTVGATSSLLQTRIATQNTVIDQKKVQDLPLNGRNFIQLTQLVPGTTPGAPVMEIRALREQATR